MCTLAVISGVLPGLPLVVLANRDEFLARRSTTPVLLDTAPRIVGGQDLEKGGTWLGVRPDGFFCGLTNRRPERLPRADARSRGEVVMEVLRAADTEAAARVVQALRPADYNGFQLLFGSADDLRTAVVWPSRPTPEVTSVGAGIHVLPTSRMNAADYPKVARLHKTLLSATVAYKHEWPALAADLHDALADHRVPALAEVPDPGPGALLDRETLCALDAICIHRPGYGTRSSALLALESGGVLHAEHAEGPACQSEFVSFLELVRG